MTRPALLLLLVLAAPAAAAAEDAGTAAADEFFTKLKTTVTKHPGRPYVWGATRTKSFDCSGFFWRVMLENGSLTKRTTARKFYILLPKATPEDHTDSALSSSSTT